MATPTNNYDFIVIGAGSGGVRSARVAAQLGARVAIIEPRALGGTCVNTGCIPKKLFTYASAFSDECADAQGFGWSVASLQFNWQQLVANKDNAIARLNGYYERLLKDANVTLLQGWARIVDAHTVAVGDKQYTGDHILIATGATAQRPPLPGQELGITSDEAFYLASLPQRVTIIGGGYIAIEFATIFHGLGCKTTLVHRRPHILREFDLEATTFLVEQLRLRGLDLRLSTTVTRMVKNDDGLRVEFADGSFEDTGLVLLATGRIPNTTLLDPKRLGIALTANGSIDVDDACRTSVPNIYAVGDVIGRMQLTPVAIAEGSMVANRLFGGTVSTIDYSKIPTTVFSYPNLASVGLSEAQARSRYPAVKVYVRNFSPLKHMLSGSKERVFMKLIVDRSSDRVLGAHMVGAEAGEIIQCLAVALQAGVTKAQVDATLAIHPTSAEEFVTMHEPTRE